MKFIKANIPGLIICEPKKLNDQRGFFTESFRRDLFENFLGYKVDFCQENLSESKYGVLRGLHFQTEPFAQSKLVSVLKGKILDVVVDIR
ncbi:MAG: dTDP-4-dehydrorhamnose 3,5-epimerase, partial [Flavobacteriaceae bacterium]|nr:dTDP-4-dehydrorhamnose 3,5-epimerase [Flavobacteriaceae bacterium]